MTDWLALEKLHSACWKALLSHPTSAITNLPPPTPYPERFENNFSTSDNGIRFLM